MNSEGKRPRAIFFDVGETLLRPRQPYGDLLREIGHQLNVDLPAKLLGGLDAHIDARVAERTEQMLPFTFPADVSQRFWYETYYGLFVRFVPNAVACRLAMSFLQLLSSPAGYTLFEETVPTLKRLREDGYRLGIISNWEGWLPELLECVGIESLFDHIVISGMCGFEKPDTRVFTLALVQGGYRPDEVIYVGDRPAHDVGPAQEAGVCPILLDRANRYPHVSTCLRIHSLSELPLVVQGLPSEGV
jgi:putative hydrolase of the HAD superfamily